MKVKHKLHKSRQDLQGVLTLKELQTAEKKILQHVQSMTYADEIRMLEVKSDGGGDRSRQSISKGVKKTSSIYRVDQFSNMACYELEGD